MLLWAQSVQAQKACIKQHKAIRTCATAFWINWNFWVNFKGRVSCCNPAVRKLLHGSLWSGQGWSGRVQLFDLVKLENCQSGKIYNLGLHANKKASRSIPKLLVTAAGVSSMPSSARSICPCLGSAYPTLGTEFLTESILDSSASTIQPWPPILQPENLGLSSNRYGWVSSAY